MRKPAFGMLGALLTVSALLPSADARASTLTDFQTRLTLTTLCPGSVRDPGCAARPPASLRVPPSRRVLFALVSERVRSSGTAGLGATNEQKRPRCGRSNAIALSRGITPRSRATAADLAAFTLTGLNDRRTAVEHL